MNKELNEAIRKSKNSDEVFKNVMEALDIQPDTFVIDDN